MDIDKDEMIIALNWYRKACYKWKTTKKEDDLAERLKTELA